MHGSFTDEQRDHRAADAILDGTVESVAIPEPQALINARFERSGDSLKIVAEGGKVFLIQDYFKSDRLAPLVTSDGYTLPGDTVLSLAGPRAPNQYAQAGAPAGGGQQQIGAVDKVSGSVTVIRNGASVTLNAGDPILKSDVIQTGAGASVVIMLIDGTALTLGASTRMAMNEFSFDPNSTNNSSLLNLLQGSFVFVAGQIAPNGGLNIETPVATMGIRGTEGGAECAAATCVAVATQGSYQLIVNGQVIGTVTVGSPAQMTPPSQPGELPTITIVDASLVNPTLFQMAAQLSQAYSQMSIPAPAPTDAGRDAPKANPQGGQSGGSSTNPALLDNGGAGPIQTTTPPPQQIAVVVTPADGGPPVTVVFTPLPDPNANNNTDNTTDDTANKPPTVANAIPSQTSNEDEPWSFTIPANTFVDPDTDNLTLTATLPDGSPLPSWLTFSNGVFSGTPPQDASGFVNIMVTASDGTASAAVIFTLAVVNVPDAPVLDASKTPALHSELEDSGFPVGAVGTLVSDLVDFANPAGQLDNVTDVDDGALLGIALTGVDSTNGTWWFTTDNGATWQLVGEVSNSSALLLKADANTRLYFQANADFYGTVTDAITFRAWDQTSGTAGQKFSTEVNGGATAFSSATDTANITINPAPDGPVVVDDTASMAENDVLFVDVLANDGADSPGAKTLLSLGAATIGNDHGLVLGTPAIVIENNQIRITPGTAFDALGVGETATITIPYTMQVAGLGIFTAAATVTVTGTNDAPFFSHLPDGLESVGSVTPDTSFGGVDAIELTTSGGVVASHIEEFLGLSDGALSAVVPLTQDGSAIKFKISLAQNETITFSWNFASSEYLPYNDYAFFSVVLDDAQIEILSRISDIGDEDNDGFVHSSGWQKLSYTASVSGQFMFGLGVMNHRDTLVDSSLYLSGFSGLGFSRTTTEEDDVEIFDLLNGARDFDTNDVLTAINIVATGHDQSGNPVDVSGAIAINGSQVSIDPQFFSWLSSGQHVTVVVNYDLSDGRTTIHNTATLKVDGVNGAPVLVVEEPFDETVEGMPFLMKSDDGTPVLFDPDVNDIITLTFEVDHGTLTLVGELPEGVTPIPDGDQDDPRKMIIQGSVDDLNEFITQVGVLYTPNADQDDTFTITAVDLHGAQDVLGITIEVQPANGSVQEDAPISSRTVSGQAIANGPVEVWSVERGVPSGPVDYTVRINSFSVVSSNGLNFQDGFNDGTRPPSPNYAINSIQDGQTTVQAVVQESGGYAILASDGAIPINAVGTLTPLVGHFVNLITNVNPTGTQGLRQADDFTVQGTFDLSLPDDIREGFGIRLTDQAMNPAANDGLELIVVRGNSGQVTVQLRHLNYSTGTVSILNAVPLDAGQGETQIVLRFVHEAGSDLVYAAFDLVNSAGELLRTVELPTPGQIFHGEDFTQAGFFAIAPSPALSYLQGQYGTLSVDQDGQWVYALANQSEAVQSLGAGDVVYDTFTILADHGQGIEETPISIKVTGVNDAPVLSLGSEVFLDAFSSWGYHGWVEIGDDDDGDLDSFIANHPLTGDFQIEHDPTTAAGNFQLRLADSDAEADSPDIIQRSFDLSGLTSAQLTFDYRRHIAYDPDRPGGDATDNFLVFVSTDGVNFLQIGNIGRPEGGNSVFDNGYQTFTVDLTPYLSDNTTIRFLVGDDVDNGDIVYVDNVRITERGNYYPGGPPVPIAGSMKIDDVDANSNIASATIVLNNKQAGDYLAIGQTVVSHGDTGSFQDIITHDIITYNVTETGGWITISLTTPPGGAAKSAFESLIGSITFANNATQPSSIPRDVSVTVNDGMTNSKTAVKTIGVANPIIGTADGGILSGTVGYDSFAGLSGADTFQFALNHGKDAIVDFQIGVDEIELFGVAGIGDLGIEDVHGDAVISLPGNIHAITLFNVAATDLTPDHFVFHPQGV